MRKLAGTVALILVLSGCGRSDVVVEEVSAPLADDAAGAEAGNNWEGAASAPFDFTQAVMGENEFNEPPPEGIVFAGSEVTIKLVDSPEGFASPVLDFDIAFEGSDQFYGFDSLGLLGCGDHPNYMDPFTELKPGGTLSGVVCIPVPEGELSGLKVVMRPTFGDRVTISP